VKRAALRVALCIVLLFACKAHAQGCSQCRDNTQQTPPRVQAAYRHAIELMAGTAALLFTGVLVVARRVR
jgi:hypothetical protein